LKSEKTLEKKSLMDSDTVITTDGKAYDVNYQSLRPIFSSKVSYRKDNDRIVALREWSGVTGKIVASETLVWSEQAGLISAGMCHPYLREEGALESNDNNVRFLLSSHKTQYKQKASSMRIDKPLVTLLSMPLEIVKNWEQLSTGIQFDRNYAVLKVQNHTVVRFMMEDESCQSVVSVTPINPVWRYIFGSLRFVFVKGKPLLKEIYGLIEPRDHKMNGKYKEYVATFKHDIPLDFGQIIMFVTAASKEN
jgi:hypothetical protein